MSFFSKLRDLFTPGTEEVVFSYPPPSELSNPGLKKPPYPFHRGHYKALELSSYYTGFGKKINTKFVTEQSGLKSLDRRLSELSTLGILDVETTRIRKGNLIRKVNTYSFNKKSYKYLREYFDWYLKK